MTSSRAAIAAIIAIAAIAGCTSTPPAPAGHAARSGGAHIEVVAKHPDDYELLGDGRVRIYSRGEFVLDHEDAKNLYIVIYTPPAVIEPTFAPLPIPVLAQNPVRDATGMLKLTDIGQGLPHNGQWRDHFAVGDILGDGSTQIVFGPARKSGGVPVAFREQADGWHRVALRVPAGHYDYGGVAIADFDGDGRSDLALAMHLTGFSVLLAAADGTFRRVDAGLPNRGEAALSGSGTAALALPGAPLMPAPLLLLQELGLRGTHAKRLPPLATFRYTPRGFVGAAIEVDPFPGNNLAFAPASATCRAKLATASEVSGAPMILETADETTWTARPVGPFPDPRAAVGAVAVGDMDGDGCSDLAVAYSSRANGTWHGVVDLYVDHGTSWRRINLLDAARGPPVTAMAIATNSGNTLLFTLDGMGTLRAYRFAAGTPELALDAPAPEWRRGCSGSDIHALPSDASGHLRIAASFAGEPTMGQFDRCRNGGGIEAWQVE